MSKAKRMTASKLDKRIEYKELVETQSDLGEVIRNWVLFKELWASVEPIRGREFYESAHTQSEVTHRIRHLYVEGLKPTMEVRLGDRVFEILHLHRVSEGTFEMEVMAKERL